MIKRSKLFQTITFQWPVKLFALAVAVLVFTFGVFFHEDVREVQIPVTTSLPDQFVAESLIFDTVEVQIRGDGNVIHLVDPGLITASVDFSYVTESGIAEAPVLLEYDEPAFSRGAITLKVEPASFRVLFGDKP